MNTINDVEGVDPPKFKQNQHLCFNFNFFLFSLVHLMFSSARIKLELNCGRAVLLKISGFILEHNKNGKLSLR